MKIKQIAAQIGAAAIFVQNGVDVNFRPFQIAKRIGSPSHVISNTVKETCRNVLAVGPQSDLALSSNSSYCLDC